MKNKGFSLVELIVVIAIMAILVGVAVPVYSAYIEKAQKAVDEQYLSDVVYAAQLYAAEHGLELGEIHIAPKVEGGQGIELYLSDGTRVKDMSGFYAMVGEHAFSNKEGFEVIYRREDVTENQDGSAECTHANKETHAATCVEDGYESCACGYYKTLAATGHRWEYDYSVGNLRIYTCEHCGYQMAEEGGDKIGG